MSRNHGSKNNASGGLGLSLSGRPVSRKRGANGSSVTAPKSDSNSSRNVSSVGNGAVRKPRHGENVKPQCFYNRVINHELKGIIRGKNNVFNGKIFGRLECTCSIVNGDVYGYADIENNQIYGNVFDDEGTLTFEGKKPGIFFLNTIFIIISS